MRFSHKSHANRMLSGRTTMFLDDSDWLHLAGLCPAFQIFLL